MRVCVFILCLCCCVEAVSQSIVVSSDGRSIVMSSGSVESIPVPLPPVRKPVKITLPPLAVLQPVESIPSPRVVQPAETMSHSEMVSLHNRLHGGGQWTWPGDLAQHLREAHGVSTKSSTVQTQRTVSNCPGGVCPTRHRTMVRSRGIFWRRR